MVIRAVITVTQMAHDCRMGDPENKIIKDSTLLLKIYQK